MKRLQKLFRAIRDNIKKQSFLSKIAFTVSVLSLVLAIVTLTTQ